MSSETKPMSRFAAACSRGIARPSTRTVPRSWRTIPIRMRIVVDLPAPLGPTKPMICPGSSRRRDVRQPEEPVGLVDAVELNHGLAHRSFSSVLRRSSRFASSPPRAAGRPSLLQSARAGGRGRAAAARCSSSSSRRSCVLRSALSATNEPLPWRVTITPSRSSSR